MFNLMLYRYFLIPSSIWFSQNCLSIAKTAAWIGNWKVFHLLMNRCAPFLWCCHGLQPSTVAVFSLQPQSKAGSSCHLTSWHVFLPAKKRTRHGTRGVDSDSSHAYTTLNFVDGGIHVTLDNHHPTDLRYLCVQKTHTEDNHLFYPQVLMSLSWSPWVKVLIRRSLYSSSFTSVWKEEFTCIPSPISSFHHLDHLLYSFSPSPFQNKLWEEGFWFSIFRTQFRKDQQTRRRCKHMMRELNKGTNNDGYRRETREHKENGRSSYYWSTGWVHEWHRSVCRECDWGY